MVEKIDFTYTNNKIIFFTATVLKKIISIANSSTAAKFEFFAVLKRHKMVYLTKNFKGLIIPLQNLAQKQKNTEA